jgi:hypothetical protein
MSKNDITGDNIISKAPSKAYEDNYDRIFRKEVDSLCSICGKDLQTTKECTWTSCPLHFEK